jgi:hypothetical protein
VIALNVRPLGRAPEIDNADVGDPVTMRVKDPAAPTAKFVLLALVMLGGTDPDSTL